MAASGSNEVSSVGAGVEPGLEMPAEILSSGEASGGVGVGNKEVEGIMLVKLFLF